MLDQSSYPDPIIEESVEQCGCQTTDNFELPLSGETLESNLPVFTVDEIADQLTDGFWSDFGGGERSFNVTTGDTLQVDLTGLNAEGVDMARAALQAWTAVSGLNFNETGTISSPSAIIDETSDADSGTGTSYTIAIGQNFTGSLSSGLDEDAIAVTLTAGQSVSFALNGGDGPDPASSGLTLELLNSSGLTLAESSEGLGHDAVLSFQATQSGTYYIKTSALDPSGIGDYHLSLRDKATGADITFDDNQSGAYASSTVSGGRILSSFVNINENWAGGSNRIDGYYYQTYLHEIGHALGLGHAGNYNGGATYGVDNHYLNDSWQSSVMSYFHQTENPFIDADFAYVITPMIADIVAIQNLYGTATFQDGDTVYGADGTTGTYIDNAFDLSSNVSFTVFDTGGADLFDFSNYSSHQVMDLRDQGISDLAGRDGNIVIAKNTVIEHGMTGSGNDTIYGNDAANALSSGNGTDVIRAGDGNDAASGGADSDDIGGGDGFDFIEGGTGDDTLTGDAGDDLMFGDDVTMAYLTELFPTWDVPVDAQALLDNGDLLALWEDIQADVFAVG